MAATFIVETGVGLTNSNSYISLADATQYHENYGAPAAWTSAAQAAKEAALRAATRYLDAKYFLKGAKTKSDQSLQWPRYDVYDRSNYLINSDSIPQAVKDCCCILALEVINGDALMADLAEQGIISSESSQVGPISESKTYIGGKSQQKQYSLVDEKMCEFEKNPGQLERC
jgi:hypothetical protein